MCKWGLALYMSDVLVFNVCWCEEDGLVTSLCTRGVVHCDSGNHYFPRSYLTADLKNLCPWYLTENANFCPVSRNSLALVFGWCHSSAVPVPATAAKVAYVVIALGNRRIGNRIGSRRSDCISAQLQLSMLKDNTEWF